MKVKDSNEPNQLSNQSGYFKIKEGVNVEDIKNLQQSVDSVKNELRRDLGEAKKEYIAIFGIFAAIITFIGIEVQAFNKLTSFGRLIGFSALLVSMLTFLIFCIERITSNKPPSIYRDPIFWVAILAFLFAIFCFGYTLNWKI